MRLPSSAASGIGGGLGAALGSALGAPGAAIRNLLDGGGGGEDSNSLLRMLPGLLALGAGGLTAFAGGGIPLAMLAASGVGGLGQAVGESTGDESFDRISGQDLGKKAGIDLGGVGGMGLEMALDPTTFAGGLGGKAAAGALERRGLAAGGESAGGAIAHAHALESAAAHTPPAAALEAAAPAAAKSATLEQSALHTPTSGAKNSWEAFLDEGNAAGKAGYRPEVTASMPDFLGVDPAKVGKTYQNVNPAMREEMSLLGWADPRGERAASLNAGQLPAWAESRGGWLMPTRARQAAAADPTAAAQMLRSPDVARTIGPKIDLAAGAEGLMARPAGPMPPLNLSPEDLLSPAERFARMREGVVGLGETPLRQHSPLAAALDDSPVSAWLRQQALAKSTGRY